MKKYSVDNFEFKSHLTENQIIERLNEKTLKKKYLTMEFTNKDFIGRINSDKFEIFDNSFIMGQLASYKEQLLRHLRLN